MSNTRADLRTYLTMLLDTGTDYSSTEYNNAINQALQQLSTALPPKVRDTGSVTGTTINLSRPVTEVDYVIIAGSYWKPLPADHPDFATGHYDIRPNEDQTLITLGASQTSAAYTVSYWAPIDYMDDDADGGLPDIHKHILYLGAIAGLLTHRQAEANAAATDSELMTFLRNAVNAHYGRFYDALLLAETIAGLEIQT